MPSIKKLSISTLVLISTLLSFLPIFVLANNYESSVEYVINGSPDDLESGDFDQDGDLDLIVAKKNRSVQIMLNDGNGQFTPGATLTADQSIRPVEVGDFDNDGDLDIVFSVSLEYSLQIFLNDGAGNFTRSDILSAYETIPREISSSDFNGDGAIDLATINHLEGIGLIDLSVSIYLGNGDGTFETLPYQNIIMPNNPIINQNQDSLSSFDVDSDGDIDIAVTIEELDSVLILKNDGYASFSTSSQISVANQPFELSVADVDLDGDSDIAVASLFFEVTILINDGLGNFNTQQILTNQETAPSSIQFLDIDNDGDMDIAVGASSGLVKSDISLYQNNSGFFTYSEKIPVGGKSVFDLVANEFSGDGLYDFVTANSVGSISVLLQKSPNSKPVLSEIGDKQITENEVLNFTILANGTNDVLLSATNIPSGATFNSLTGEFLWTPGFNAAGTYSVTFIATENSANPLSDSETIDIIVLNSNRAPIISPIGNKNVTEGSSINFAVSAIDPDGDIVSLSALNLPNGATFNQSDGLFSWETDFEDAGNYTNIEFIATDDGSPLELSMETITITVGNVNRLPEILNPGPQTVLEGETVSFFVTASDPDNGSVILSASNLPVGATFNSVSGSFNWNTDLNDSGNYVVRITATDDGIPSQSSSADIVITVGDKQNPVEQVISLIVLIDSLNIPQNVENSYFANLQKVEQFILDGKITPALNQLNAFKNKVNQDYANGLISLTNRNELLSAANSIINDLSN